MSSFLKEECDLEYFHDMGFIRKKCESCGDYFWTLDEKARFCDDQPCVEFNFIDKPLGEKPLSLGEVRESFLSYFEKHNHSRLSYPVTGERCPVVARWRNDIYLTIASIADFQPHVTSGEVPPPANPLAISQPCIRLNDLEEVGVSGRHLTTFEMMGHHAFNKNYDEIYFKNKTVEYCDDYFVNHIGIPREEIKYKEQLWSGGGNAGPCLEVLAEGLEIATLVFMNMTRDDEGEFEIKGEKYTRNPLQIVDTGYGLERIAWITQGTKTVYETVFPDVIKWIEGKTDDGDKSLIYALADHSKCLAFMLGDGIVPSNAKAGYLSRLIIRRSLRFLEKLKVDFSLKDLVDLQLNVLKKDFPSLMSNHDQVMEILDLETERYQETLSKGKNLVKRIIKEETSIDTDQLINLYDTHGMPPEIVKNIAEEENVKVEIPENFDSMVAELHSHEEKSYEKEEKNISLPPTHPLYYDDHYQKEFDAKILWKKNTPEGLKLILDQTVFYPEGGGQPADEGFLVYDEKQLEVKKVVKEKDSIIHVVDAEDIVEEGKMVHGEIDWDKRYKLMKHHTGTHVVNGALRKILGEHVWQAGSQLGVDEGRFDYSHYRTLPDEKVEEIENLANKFVEQEIEVKKKVLDRNTAEKEYGFRLYQGGVPPGNSIRVLDIPGVDVEACGGTHLNNIGEIGKIRIIRSERIQDGVNRVVFAAGEMVDAFEEEEKKLYDEAIDKISQYYKVEKREDFSKTLDEVCNIFSVQRNQLLKTLKRFLKETDPDLLKEKQVESLDEACTDLFEKWKQTQKAKKNVSNNQIESFLDKAESIPGTDIKVIVGKTENEGTSLAGELINSSDNLVVHVFDGKKLVSMASEEVDIDLREITKPVGDILGGGGGGKPDMVQCGGPNIDRIDEALEKAKQLTEKLLKKTD
ncbi:MAG: alanine--tRNA ligase [Candidatus Thermoplasmatota archaeon]